MARHRFLISGRGVPGIARGRRPATRARGTAAGAVGLLAVTALCLAAFSASAGAAGVGRETGSESATVTVSAAPMVVDYDGTTTVEATLGCGTGALPCLPVSLWSSTEASPAWSLLTGSIWNSLSDRYEWPARLVRNTRFEARFSGDATYSASSSSVWVQSRALLTTPTASSVIESGGLFRVWGRLRPDHASSAGTRLYFSLYRTGGYQLARVADAQVSPDSSTSSRYSATYSLPSAGRWQVQARHSDSDHATSWSRPLPLVVHDIFQRRLAMADILRLSGGIGARRGGYASERRGANYIASRLARCGYKVRFQRFRLPRGRTSQNVIASKPGAQNAQMIIGAHYDSEYPSPGANDNGSGVATLLELARVLKGRPTQPTVVFVFFGAEEIGHVGSRTYVARLTRSQKRMVAGMISVDMVGYGSTFCRRTMRHGPQGLSGMLYNFARRRGTRLSFLEDEGRVGSSDHAPFEFAGMPAVWLEWRYDPTWHSMRDVYRRVERTRIERSGRLLQKFVTGISSREVAALVRANWN